MNSINTITAGIQNRGVHNAPTSYLSGAPNSLTDINTLAVAATQKVAKLKEIRDGFKAAVEKYSAEASAKWAETGRTVDDEGRITDNLGRDRRQNLLRADVAKYAKTAAAVSAEARVKLTAELNQIKAAISSVESLWSSPVAVLTREAIGQRAARMRETEHSGAYELDVLMKHAVLTGDKALAAACFSRLDAMTREERAAVTVRKDDVATALCGETHKKAMMNIHTIGLATLEAEVAVAEIEGKTISTQLKLALGAKRRAFETDYGTEESNDDATVIVEQPEDMATALDRKFPSVKGSVGAGTPLGG